MNARQNIDRDNATAIPARRQSISVDGFEVIVEIPPLSPPAISAAYAGWPAPDAPMVEFALYYARLAVRLSMRQKGAADRARQGCKRQQVRGTGGFYKATTDEDQICSWWKKWPGAMIGIRAGQASGVFAIDPDGEMGRRTGRRSLPSTATFRALTCIAPPVAGIISFSNGTPIARSKGQRAK